MNAEYTLYIEPVNDVYMKVLASPGVAQELVDYFTFHVPGAQWSAKYKAGIWDGKWRLYNNMTCLMYTGLLHRVYQFASERGYEIEDSTKRFSFADEDSFREFLAETVTTLPEDRKPRDYQLAAVWNALTLSRMVMLCPTASGKSLIIYLTIRYLNAIGAGPALIVVPTKNLVGQMRSDFISYGANPDDIEVVVEGQNRGTNKPIVISTWQSIYEQKHRKFFERYRVFFGDEAHLFKSKSLVTLMERLKNCPVKIGTTGTLDGSLTHKLVLEGLFGPVKRFTTTKKLIAAGHNADLKIVSVVLNWPEEIRRVHRTAEYSEELELISSSQARNKMICDMVTKMEGNTLVLVQLVKKHAVPLLQMMKECTDRPVHFISGTVSADDREESRQQVMVSDNAIIVATYQTYATGVNIPNLNNLVLASPTKSKIRLLQSVGRVLRKAPGKEYATLLDLADDLSWKGRMNHTLRHYMERQMIYAAEGFEVKEYRRNLA